MIGNEQRSEAENLLVELLLDIRAGHLASSQANPLKHWEQLENAIVAAARTSSSLNEWCTKVATKMGISNLNSSAGNGLRQLVTVCDEANIHLQLLQTIESEHSYVMALVRGAAEARKEARDAAALPDKETLEKAAKEHGILEEQ